MGICSRFCTPPVESSASRVVVPCVKGKCCRPSTSTEFESTPPSQLAGIISADEYQASIARINASLKRPLWTYRVQTVGRILLLLGFILLLVAGGKFLHMKHKHHGEKHDRRHKQNGPVAPVAPLPGAAENARPVPAMASFSAQVPDVSPPSVVVPPLQPTDADVLPEPIVEPIYDPAWGFEEEPISPPEDNEDEVNGEVQQSEEERDEDDDNDDDEEERRMAWRERHGHHGRRHGKKSDDDKKDAAGVEEGKEGKKHGRKHHKKCIKHMFHAGLWSMLVGFVLCRWMVGRKQRELINRVVPAVCAEHHLYTSAHRPVPVSWSLDERSVCRYNCKNNALKLVLDLHTTVPLSRMEVKAQQSFDVEKHLSAGSAYVPLTTNEQA